MFNTISWDRNLTWWGQVWDESKLRLLQSFSQGCSFSTFFHFSFLSSQSWDPQTRAFANARQALYCRAAFPPSHCFLTGGPVLSWWQWMRQKQGSFSLYTWSPLPVFSHKTFSHETVDNDELSCRCWTPKTDHLQEHQVHLTAEPSLQASGFLFFNFILFAEVEIMLQIENGKLTLFLLLLLFKS